MFLICDRDILIGATSPALCAISSKGTVQALECFLLSADKDTGILTVCGYDMEKGVKVTLSGDDIQIAESGRILINAAKFSSILRNLPAGNVAVKTDENMIVSISSKTRKSEFTMHGLDSEAYPLLPELSGPATFSINRNVLRSMITATHFAVASNSSTPALNGALFEINQNSLNIIALDRPRIALRRSFDGVAPNDTPDLQLSFIVPGKSLSELLKLIGDTEDPVEIQITRKHAILSFDNLIFFSRLIDSDFPDYKRLININPVTTVIIDTKSFIESVERASLLTDDRLKSLVTLTFGKNGNNNNGENSENSEENAGNANSTLQITSTTTLGNTYEECDIEMEGEDIVMGFNHRYLSDALKACGEEKIMLILENPTKSMLLLPYNTPAEAEEGSEPVAPDVSEMIATGRFLYLVLPIRPRD